MDAATRIEQALSLALSQSGPPHCPPRLSAAMHHAVFPRGARVRPRLCLAVAHACGEDNPVITDSAAASIELLHCASLVHDDLPCFDDADTRRGKPSVHRAYGEALAVLAGDALIVLAFQALDRTACEPKRMALLLPTVSRSVGVPLGIVAGQAWECETQVNVANYHRAKTGALFSAASMAGAAATGADPEPWRAFGEFIGEAYQVADDIRDAAAEEDELGKPVGKDAKLGRPSAVAELGLSGALRKLDTLATGASDSVPPCEGAHILKALVAMEVKRLLPKRLAACAA